MSKQSDAKKAQGYVTKFVPPVCSRCVHFASDMEQKTTYYRREYEDGHRDVANEWVVEKNLHCTLGGFTVKKMGACNLFLAKE